METHQHLWTLSTRCKSWFPWLVQKLSGGGWWKLACIGWFNYIRYPHNRNRDGGSINDMFLFNEAISTQALVKIPLKGRKFTWSNMQEARLLEKRDSCFTSETWTIMFPSSQAIPLAKTTSGHIPIVSKVGTCIPRSQIFRFENFWPKHPQFKEVVKNNWEQEVHETDSAKCIAAKFKRLRKGLRNWAGKFLISRASSETPIVPSCFMTLWKNTHNSHLRKLRADWHWSKIQREFWPSRGFIGNKGPKLEPTKLGKLILNTFRQKILLNSEILVFCP